MASCPNSSASGPRALLLRRPRPEEDQSGPQQDGERGNAIVEFVFLALVLMVPSVYALLVISHAQAGALAAVAAGQQAVQVVETGDRANVSAEQAQAAARFAAEDYGFAGDQVATRISCSGDCTADQSLSVHVTVSVDLPMLGWLSHGGVVTMQSTSSSWGGKYE